MDFTPKQLRLAPINGFTVHADFAAEGLSADFGPVLLKGIDEQIGLTKRLSAALIDRRNASYVTHLQHDILAQRIYQIACGYADGNDCTTLRDDPMFRLAMGRDPFDKGHMLASASTISRLEHAARRRDIYRLSSALIDQFIASYASPPKLLVLDIDHTEDKVHGQQPLALYNHYYRSTCYLPLLIFEGLTGALVAAVLRSSMRPTGAENTMIIKRVLKRIRRHFPDTHILVRGDGHFSNPELMDTIDGMPNTDFVFGLPGNKVLELHGAPAMQRARHLHTVRLAHGESTPVQLFDEFNYAAGTWSRPRRVIQKAEVMAKGDNPRYVVTSMTKPDPKCVYTEIYCGRGQAENFIKGLKNDLESDRTSCTTFLANCMRLLEHAAAYVLHQTLRAEVLQHTPLAQAQPASVILKLFKITTLVKRYKGRVILHLPSSCIFKNVLQTVTERLLVGMPKRTLNTC